MNWLLIYRSYQNPSIPKLPSPQLPTAKFTLEDIDANNLLSTLNRFIQINLEVNRFILDQFKEKKTRIVK